MPASQTQRNPEKTRDAILAAAAVEIFAQGFRGASLERILSRTGVTKGALYHHFPNKLALGYAVVDEVIFPRAIARWEQVLSEVKHPVDALLALGPDQRPTSGHETTELGCPINNLIQEMAAIDTGFRERLDRCLNQWRDVITNALRQGQADGLVRADVLPGEAAAFMVAAYEGSMCLAKCACGPELLNDCLTGLAAYIDGLRTPETATAVN